jgi:hypothetical protein
MHLMLALAVALMLALAVALVLALILAIAQCLDQGGFVNHA